MIDHVFPDGSRGHEFEVGDRVAILTPEYSLRGGVCIEPGAEGVVDAVKPYNKTSTYHTTFYWIKLDGSYRVKRLQGNLEPRCEPRILVPAEDEQ